MASAGRLSHMPVQASVDTLVLAGMCVPTDSRVETAVQLHISAVMQQSRYPPSPTVLEP